MSGRRERLDKLIVERRLAPSRERARQLVMAGVVFVGDQRCDKPGTMVRREANIEIRNPALPFVSRGGLKLDAALTHWQLAVHGLVAADIGASTGGFTDCLLQRGARHVYAIDVGHGQLAWSLRQDHRVTVFERTNVRTFDPAQLPERVDVVVVDVSFISLRLILPTAVKMARSAGILLPLVKPQFEAGREAVGKGGVVRDPAARQTAVDGVRAFAEELGLRCHGAFASPVLGPKGNQEFFLYLLKTAAPPPALAPKTPS
jgi:23S rRNA (cytidine1920-2'-O)/16S rRNA (cytidine1409-2'-O)-methyltransferase